MGAIGGVTAQPLGRGPDIPPILGRHVAMANKIIAAARVYNPYVRPKVAPFGWLELAGGRLVRTFSRTDPVGPDSGTGKWVGRGFSLSIGLRAWRRRGGSGPCGVSTGGNNSRESPYPHMPMAKNLHGLSLEPKGLWLLVRDPDFALGFALPLELVLANGPSRCSWRNLYSSMILNSKSSTKRLEVPLIDSSG